MLSTAESEGVNVETGGGLGASGLVGCHGIEPRTLLGLETILTIEGNLGVVERCVSVRGGGQVSAGVELAMERTLGTPCDVFAGMIQIHSQVERLLRRSVGRHALCAGLHLADQIFVR